MSGLQLRFSIFTSIAFLRIYPLITYHTPSNYCLEMNRTYALKEEDIFHWVRTMMKSLLNISTQAFNSLVSCRITWCNQILLSQVLNKKQPSWLGRCPRGGISVVQLSLPEPLLWDWMNTRRWGQGMGGRRVRGEELPINERVMEHWSALYHSGGAALLRPRAVRQSRSTAWMDGPI